MPNLPLGLVALLLSSLVSSLWFGLTELDPAIFSLPSAWLIGRAVHPGPPYPYSHRTHQLVVHLWAASVLLALLPLTLWKATTLLSAHTLFQLAITPLERLSFVILQWEVESNFQLATLTLAYTSLVAAGYLLYSRIKQIN